MQLTTFGFEFEVQTEAAALTRHLYDTGLCGTPTMCRWHCRCEMCSYYSGFVFRAQTDSSCNGEIISGILHHDPHDHHHVPGVFTTLQDAALEVDAEPGLAAGLHVHVGINHLSTTERARTLWAFLRYEQLLIRLSAGRFEEQRSGGNAQVRDMLALHLRNHDPNYSAAPLDAIASIEQSPNIAAVQRNILDYHSDNDRHSNLNISTGHGTWEFRLWNSTRAAWRLELFTRLSVALVDPDVVRRMLATDITRRVTRSTADRFAVLLHDAGHERCAELVDRQATYSWDAAALAPSTLTSF